MEGIRGRLQRLGAAKGFAFGCLEEQESIPEREKPKAKLSYKESRELEALPKAIEALEAEQQALAAKMSEPEYYRQGAETLKADQKRGADIEALLHEKLERWEALEARAKAAAS